MTSGYYPDPRQYLHTSFKNAKNNNDFWGFGTQEVDDLIEIYEKNLDPQARLRCDAQDRSDRPRRRVQHPVPDGAVSCGSSTGTTFSSRSSTCRCARSNTWIGWSIGSIQTRRPRSRKRCAPTRPSRSIENLDKDFYNVRQEIPVTRSSKAHFTETHLALLEIDNLRVGFDTEAGLLVAVDGVSFTIEQGQTLGLVGESGCGKSVTATSILRLVPNPPGRILGGAIRFGDIDILKLKREELPKIRGKDIAMIFQDPMTSLNPVFTVEKQMGEVLKLRFGMDREAARQTLRRDARDRRHSRSGDAAHELSARALRRPEAARDDRHGAAHRAAPPDRRRAHHRARRDGAGADPAA